MLHVSTWSRIVTSLILLMGILISLPNVLPSGVVSKLPRFLPSDTLTLGLDLQGGSSLLLEVQMDKVQQERYEQLRADERLALRKAHVVFEFDNTVTNAVSVHIISANRYDDARTIVKNFNPLTGGGIMAAGARAYDMTEANNTITLKMSDAYRTQLQSEILNQSIEVVRRRIDALGTREPTIERQGEDRILVQVPGLSDPQHLIILLGKTAKMTFQMVDEAATNNIEEARKGRVPVGSELLKLDHPLPGEQPDVVVEKRVMVAGDRLTSARQDFDQQTNAPDIAFTFDTVGAREFGNATKDNVGHRFAIVLDGKVISDPTIRSAILGGSGVITGNFTLQSAGDLAKLLSAGALPAPLSVLDQRVVGPELGADSIRAGKYSAIGGLILVALFMIARYGLFGLFADVALTLNIVLLIACLTLFHATLTLPGIAGIVLTMGMAVDANVLIYERIREEQRNGRSMLASIDTGFRRAMATIVDANATHLIASLILFQLGSGPVRGFAVTLGVGIITSFFTAVMVTRLIVVTWLGVAKPRKLSL
ncbi:MAG TPA: protein translocase subunit SecD [Rhizomicrobium sp.]|jgi:protein-export membrane protein SecD